MLEQGFRPVLAVRVHSVADVRSVTVPSDVLVKQVGF